MIATFFIVVVNPKTNFEIGNEALLFESCPKVANGY